MAIIQSFFGKSIPETCGNCLQHKGCKNPCITYSGKGKEKILIIGEYPSSAEDRNNEFFSGDTGRIFRQQLKLMGYNLEEDFWYTKAVGCTSAKPPSKSIINKCREVVYGVIEKLKPKAIFVMGNIAIDSILGSWIDIASANSLSGLQIPLHDQNCWVFPMFASEYVAKNKRDENLNKYFTYTLVEALKKCKNLQPLKKLEYLDDINILTDPKEIIEAMQDIIISRKPSAFDIETSGLNPWVKGHRIFSIGIATEEKTISFALDYPKAYSNDDLNDIWDIVYEYLENKDCPKIAHRTEFEYLWTKVAIQADTKNMYWCTKTTQHILDNRTGITGLKHQCFVRWGVKEFGKAANNYIKSIGGTAFNKMHLMPLMDQLLYVGTDAWMTFHLYQCQKEELKSLDTQRFFNDVTNMFSEMSINGICTDSRFYEQEKIEIEKLIDVIYQELYESQEIISYENKYSKINFTSNDDIRLLFFTHLKCESSKDTKGGQASVDFTSLEKTDHWIAKKLLKVRKLLKIKDTYIAQFQREVIDGKIHPSFNVYIARSLRSSSKSPNFQNIPKRDELSKIKTRSGLKPSPGNRLVELDFSGAEVITSAAYNKDPNLINYLLDESTDMHRDCYSSDTKYLTENGFKYYRSIKKKEKVAQYNPDIDKIEFVFPTNSVCHDYEGDMHCIKNRYVDILVTPKHRMYLKQINENFKVIEARDIKRSSYYVKTGADTKKQIISSPFYFEAVYGTGRNITKKYHSEFFIKPDDMFELLGYLITNGHFKYHKQGAYRINLSQIKEPHRSIMKECIDRIKSYTNFKFHEEKDKWSMSNKSFCVWLCSNFGVNKINRKIPNFIKYAPKKQLKMFVNSCILGDGGFNKSGRSGGLYTVSFKFIEDFQFICMRLGYSSRVKKIKLKGNRKIQVYIIYMLYDSERHIKTQDSSVYKTKKYKGEVSCFTVPSGLLIVQRNNKITIQGNCAADIWSTSSDNISKMVRFYAKNCWTFPQFYGDYFGSCAKALWEHKDEKLESGMTCHEYLKSKNIGTLKKFTDHCKRAEEKMWGDRFKVYDSWRKDVQKIYQDNVFNIGTYFDFNFTGYMDWKQVANYPIQGTSFHLLLKVLLKMWKWLKKEKMKTKICGQIHDSGFFDSPENEYQKVIKQFQKYTKALKEEYKWLPVEMKADADISLLDGDFARMFEWKWDVPIKELEEKAKKKWAKTEYELLHLEE